MIKKALWLGLALSALLAFPASADEWNEKTVLTFSQPFEIPGYVLPAGTSTFMLADIQTVPLESASTVVSGTVALEQTGPSARTTLPQTSSNLTVIALVGCVSICLGSLLMLFRRPAPIVPR